MTSAEIFKAREMIDALVRTDSLSSLNSKSNGNGHKKTFQQKKKVGEVNLIQSSYPPRI